MDLLQPLGDSSPEMVQALDTQLCEGKARRSFVVILAPVVEIPADRNTMPQSMIASESITSSLDSALRSASDVTPYTALSPRPDE